MDKIAILDFGSQFAHLLANRVRRLGVYSEILDAETPASELREYKGLIISGGPASVKDPSSPKVDPAVYELKDSTGQPIPILGVCYGHQLTMHTLGGTVGRGTVGEYGLTRFTVQKPSGVLGKLEQKSYQVYASHFDAVTALPKGFEALGSTPDDPYSATANEARKIYTVQFHPEVTHTECGMQILETFVEITGATRDWSIEKFIELEIAAITKKVTGKDGTSPPKKVFMLVSGGVDSTVAYALLAKALGPDSIYAMYVDTGFMRKGETEQIKASLASIGITNLHTYDAKDEYFTALKGIYDPEKKREIIGNLFLEIQRKVAKEQNLNPEEWLLGQGTIYPDTIESGGTKNADKIKTHHNRVPEIEEMIRRGLIIEPLKELYKDEVRMVGTKLGLPEKMVHRHPFPGPGLAVRCLCLEKEDGEYKRGQYSITDTTGSGSGNYITHLLPIKSVGVQGDERTYRHPLVLEGAQNWDSLRTAAPVLVNMSKDINRVLLSVATNGPISSVSVTPGYLTPQRIATLQEADALVNEALPQLDPENKVWQFPVVLLPLSINSKRQESKRQESKRQESIVLRPVSSTEAMTANFTELPWEGVKKLAEKILALEGISAVFYDITNKPPGTIEWE